MKKLVLIILLFSGLSASAQTTTTVSPYRKDFDFLWNTVDSNYCYFNKKPIDWKKVKEIYAPQIDTVTSRDGFVKVMERVLYELYDHHIELSTNNKFSAPPGANWYRYAKPNL